MICRVAFSRVIAPDREQLEAHGLDNGPDSRNGVYVIRKTDDTFVDPVVLVGGLGECGNASKDIQMPGSGHVAKLRAVTPFVPICCVH